MKVDFNNLRKQTCFVYDRLAKKLNREVNENGKIYIDADEIQSEMDELRMLISSIASTYIEGDDEVKDVYAEAYPGDRVMIEFNPETE